MLPQTNLSSDHENGVKSDSIQTPNYSTYLTNIHRYAPCARWLLWGEKLAPSKKKLPAIIQFELDCKPESSNDYSVLNHFLLRSFLF